MKTEERIQKIYPLNTPLIPLDVPVPTNFRTFFSPEFSKGVLIDLQNQKFYEFIAPDQKTAIELLLNNPITNLPKHHFSIGYHSKIVNPYGYFDSKEKVQKVILEEKIPSQSISLNDYVIIEFFPNQPCKFYDPQTLREFPAKITDFVQHPYKTRGDSSTEEEIEEETDEQEEEIEDGEMEAPEIIESPAIKISPKKTGPTKTIQKTLF